jgi:hypothetical protein
MDENMPANVTGESSREGVKYLFINGKVSEMG